MSEIFEPQQDDEPEFNTNFPTDNVPTPETLTVAASMDDYVTDTEPVDLGVDPDQIVTIRTSSGQSHYVAVDGALTLAEIKVKSGLNFGVGTQVFLNNTVVTDSTVIPAGSTITAIGSVKGGQF